MSNMPYRNPNTCPPEKSNKCEKRLNIEPVKGLCGEYSYEFDGVGGSFNIKEGVECSESVTTLDWNDDKCEMQYADELYISSKGLRGKLHRITAAQIFSCFNLCDSGDVECADAEDCDMLLKRKGVDANGCPTDEDKWISYTPPEVNEAAFLGGYNEEGCPVKLTCAEEKVVVDDCGNEKVVTEKCGKSQIVCEDGVFKCEKICNPQAGKADIEFTTPDDGDPGSGMYLPTTGEFGSGIQEGIMANVTWTNNTECCMLYCITIQGSICLTNVSDDLDAELGIGLTSNFNSLSGLGANFVPIGQVTGPANPSGFNSALGQINLCYKVPAGETLELGIYSAVTVFTGTFNKFASTIGFTTDANSDPVAYQIVCPTYTATPYDCDDVDNEPVEEEPGTPETCLEQAGAVLSEDGFIDIAEMTNAEWTNLYTSYADCQGIDTEGWVVYEDGSYTLGDGTTGCLPQAVCND